MKKAFIVKLLDQDNDILIKIVDESTWNWINLSVSGQKGKKSYWEDKLCPDTVRESIRNWWEQNDPMSVSGGKRRDPKEFAVMISSGAWNNDRAIQAAPLESNRDFQFYGNTRALLKKIKEAKALGYEVNIDKEYSGLIY